MISENNIDLDIHLNTLENIMEIIDNRNTEILKLKKTNEELKSKLSTLNMNLKQIKDDTEDMNRKIEEKNKGCIDPDDIDISEY